VILVIVPPDKMLPPKFTIDLKDCTGVLGIIADGSDVLLHALLHDLLKVWELDFRPLVVHICGEHVMTVSEQKSEKEASCCTKDPPFVDTLVAENVEKLCHGPILVHVHDRVLEIDGAFIEQVGHRILQATEVVQRDLRKALLKKP
jgi:hypothetical protein